MFVIKTSRKCDVISLIPYTHYQKLCKHIKVVPSMNFQLKIFTLLRSGLTYGVFRLPKPICKMFIKIILFELRKFHLEYVTIGIYVYIYINTIYVSRIENTKFRERFFVEQMKIKYGGKTRKIISIQSSKLKK